MLRSRGPRGASPRTPCAARGSRSAARCPASSATRPRVADGQALREKARRRQQKRFDDAHAQHARGGVCSPEVAGVIKEALARRRQLAVDDGQHMRLALRREALLGAVAQAEHGEQPRQPVLGVAIGGWRARSSRTC